MMPQDMLGKGILSMWDGGFEVHHTDAVVPHVNWRAIERFARQAMYADHEREVCGVFIRCRAPHAHEDSDVHAVYLENQSVLGGQFSLSDNDARRVYQWLEDGQLLGIWHSHPNGRRDPSELDWRGHPHGVPMYIISMESHDEVLVMRYDDEDRPGHRRDWG